MSSREPGPRNNRLYEKSAGSQAADASGGPRTDYRSCSLNEDVPVVPPPSRLDGRPLPPHTNHRLEAARVLYAQHSVEAIARHDSKATYLRLTSQRLESLVDEARTQGRKILCFVTGVPGAGKTLVGLNLATQRRAPDAPTHAVFLSGNGPLVAVLREALTRDDVERRKARGERATKANAGEPVKAFTRTSTTSATKPCATPGHLPTTS